MKCLFIFVGSWGLHCIFFIPLHSSSPVMRTLLLFNIFPGFTIFRRNDWHANQRRSILSNRKWLLITDAGFSHRILRSHLFIVIIAVFLWSFFWKIGSKICLNIGGLIFSRNYSIFSSSIWKVKSPSEKKNKRDLISSRIRKDFLPLKYFFIFFVQICSYIY